MKGSQELTLNTPVRSPLPAQAEGQAASLHRGKKDASQTGLNGAPAPQRQVWSTQLGQRTWGHCESKSPTPRTRSFQVCKDGSMGLEPLLAVSSTS